MKTDTTRQMQKLLVMTLTVASTAIARDMMPSDQSISDQSWSRILANTRNLPAACDSQELGTARRARAEAALHLGQWSVAEDSLQPCASRLPTDEPLLRTALKTARLQGNAAQIQDYGQLYITLQPTSPAGYLAVARAWQLQGQPTRALPVLDDGLLRQQHHSLYAEKAALLLAMADPVSAQYAIDQAIRLAPAIPDYRALRAQVALRRHQPLLALTLLNDVFRQVPVAPAEWHLWRAEAEARLDRWEASGQDAYTALLLSPSVESYVLICRSALAMRDWAALTQYAENALRNGFDDVRLRRYLAQAQEEQGQGDKARQTWLALLEKFPDDRAARLQLARLASTRGDWSAASEQLDTLISQQADGESLALSAYVHLRQGHTGQARDNALNAMTLSPKEVMAMLVLADVALGSDNALLANDYCQQAKHLLPSQPLVLATCARVHARLQQLDLARAELALAEQLAPADAEVLRASQLIKAATPAAQGVQP